MVDTTNLRTCSGVDLNFLPDKLFLSTFTSSSIDESASEGGAVGTSTSFTNEESRTIVIVCLLFMSNELENTVLVKMKNARFYRFREHAR